MRILTIMLLVCIIIPTTSFANGCIVVRPTSQLAIGLHDAHKSMKGNLDLVVSYRYLYSDRHFRGAHEETHRQEEGTEVRNRISTIDLSLNYWWADKWHMSVGIPYSTATRSSLYEHDRVNRHTMESSGIGDLRLIAYRDFAIENGGITLGLGIKLPTGSENNKDIAYRPDGPEERYVDQSIQMGDGGTGLIAEFQYYRKLISENSFGFITISYLINPEDTNGIPTHRSNQYERVQSIPDTYQFRFGLTSLLGSSWGVDVSIRGEGVPAEDFIGDSNGFRRPGYAIYFEPAIAFQHKGHRANLSIPYAIARERVKSVADKRSGGHGDAAFADYLIMASYSYFWN